MPTTLIKRLTLLWIALAGLFFLWESRGYRGFFERAAEWQIDHLGFYKPVVTVLFLAFVVSVPIILVMLILKRRRQRVETIAFDGPPRTAGRYLTLLNAAGLVFAIAALGFIVASLFLPDASPPVRDLAVSAAGEPAQGPTRLVGSTADGRIALFTRNYLIGRRDTRFAALNVPRTGTTRYFAEIDPGDPNPDARGGRTGILVRNGLPGTIRTLYEGIGIPVATPHYVLYRSTTSYKLSYYLSAAEFGLVALLCFVLGMVQARRVRRLRAETGRGIVAVA